MAVKVKKRTADSVKLGRTIPTVITFQRKTRTLAEWAEVVGKSHQLIRSRILRGMSVRDALLNPPHGPARERKAELRKTRAGREAILADRRRQVMSLRSGGKTWAEIGRQFGRSKQWAQQTYQAARRMGL